jgi:DNA-binding transcriptional MerR regulator
MFAKEPTPAEIKRFLEDENKKDHVLEGVKRKYMKKFLSMYELLEAHVKEEEEKLKEHQEHIKNERAILSGSSDKAVKYRDLLQEAVPKAFHVL